MKRDLPAAASPELDRFFHELAHEEAGQAIRERRSTNREPLVRPVRLFALADHGRELIAEGFSKNFSPVGIGLVTREKPDEGLVAVVEIHRFGKAPVYVLAECRWRDNFGGNWHLSGWKFLSVVRS